MDTTDNSGQRVPEVHELTALNPQFRENPWPMLAAVRSQCPAHRSDFLRQVLFTRAEDVASILRNPDLWSDPRKSHPESPNAAMVRDADADPSMLMADDPLHKRLRGLVAKAFTPRAIESWRPRARVRAEALLDAVSTDAFDLIAELAGPLPAIIIAEMLGVDSSRWEWFKHCSDTASYAFFNPLCSAQQRAEGERSGEALNEYFLGRIEEIRSGSEQDNLISRMLNAEVEGEQLTTQEVVTQCNLLLIAGNITTTDLIGNGTHALLTHRDQWELLVDEPTLVTNAVEELLRFCPPVMNSGRIASSDAEFAGCPVERGESLSVSLGAANRDPAVCDDPDTLDIRRENPRHLSFGGGRHFCIGAPLARLEAQEAFLALIQRYPELHLSERAGERRDMPVFSGFRSLWVQVG